jgi:hypothetical protein
MRRVRNDLGLAPVPATGMDSNRLFHHISSRWAHADGNPSTPVPASGIAASAGTDDLDHFVSFGQSAGTRCLYARYSAPNLPSSSLSSKEIMTQPVITANAVSP